jgi:ketopantoate hydroxymethyltransferase
MVFEQVLEEVERAVPAERIAAFREFSGDVGSGAYPEAKHNVSVAPEVPGQFQQFLAQQS